MENPIVLHFEANVKHTLDWSNIDPRTRSVLEALMKDVAQLAREMIQSQ